MALLTLPRFSHIHCWIIFLIINTVLIIFIVETKWRTKTFFYWNFNEEFYWKKCFLSFSFTSQSMWLRKNFDAGVFKESYNHRDSHPGTALVREGETWKILKTLDATDVALIDGSTLSAVWAEIGAFADRGLVTSLIQVYYGETRESVQLCWAKKTYSIMIHWVVTQTPLNYTDIIRIFPDLPKQTCNLGNFSTIRVCASFGQFKFFLYTKKCTQTFKLQRMKNDPLSPAHWKINVLIIILPLDEE